MSYTDRLYQPYLKPSFWMDPNQHFWETIYYSEKSKGYFREWIGRIRDEQDKRNKVNLLSLETRAKMSKSRMGNQNRLGVLHTEETKAKMRVTRQMKRLHQLQNPNPE